MNQIIIAINLEDLFNIPATRSAYHLDQAYFSLWKYIV